MCLVTTMCKGLQASSNELNRSPKYFAFWMIPKGLFKQCGFTLLKPAAPLVYGVVVGRSLTGCSAYPLIRLPVGALTVGLLLVGSGTVDCRSVLLLSDSLHRNCGVVRVAMTWSK